LDTTTVLSTAATAMNPAPPSRKMCLELMDRCGMLPHIRLHSLAVCRIACAIAVELNRTGLRYDRDEIEAAALLHDITKTRSIITGENHAGTGSALLRDLGYARIAGIVAEHINPRDGGAALTPAEIVSYADKRILHTRIVSLDERFAYLYDRYGRSAEALRRIDATRARADAIEQKILHALGQAGPARRGIVCEQGGRLSF
jgi:uncharacterized protein